MNILKKMCVIALGMAGTIAQANADEVKLIFATINPAESRISQQLFHAWADRINAQGKGIVNIDVRDGYALASFANIYDRVKDDVVQIGFAILPQIAGKFQASEVAALPIWDDSEQAALAFWRLYKNGALGSEYDEVVPLALSPTVQSVLHFPGPIKATDDLTGLKIMVAGRVPGQIISQAGGTPISLPLADVYSGLQRQTVDGAGLGWTSFDAFKLGEVTSYHVEAKIGSSGSMVFMSKKRFDGLPEAARKILLDNSGEAFSRTNGAWWRGEKETALSIIKATGKHTIVYLNADQQKKWEQKLNVVVDDWARTHQNGDKIIAMFKEELARAQAGK